MNLPCPYETEIASETFNFYRNVVTILSEANLPFLVGGAYGLAHFTGIIRHTKDLDLFIRPSDVEPVLDTLNKEGFVTSLTDPIWLGKAFSGADFVDFIFRSGNGLGEVDDGWFRHAEVGRVFGEAVEICPVEETIWSKAFTMERDRFDGADIAHLILKRGADMDWERLVLRFNGHWRVLLSHLILFGFIYPHHASAVPRWVMEHLAKYLLQENPRTAPANLCQGTLLSRTQYRADLDLWGYEDARFQPHGTLTNEETTEWKFRSEHSRQSG